MQPSPSPRSPAAEPLLADPFQTPPRAILVRALSVLAIALQVGVAGAAAAPFGFDQIAAIAQKLAQKGYEEPEANLPKEIQSLSYERYREIRFKPDKALWRGQGLPFEVMFFHQGLYYDKPVRISEVRTDGVHEVRFSADQFDYGAGTAPKQADGLQYAGLRVHYAINKPDYKDEVAVFLGASYFRAIGRDQHYGLSARGLALDTAQPSGEEFPRFVQFWLVRPGAKADSLTVYALLDSKRATGAYRFIIKPGTETVTEVSARVFLRSAVGKLALAPLTSMYFFGADQRPQYEDYRAQVHDSEGLSVHMGNGEWIWRPLQNPAQLSVSSFQTEDPKGFGLMQRTRTFEDYEDLDARYERRPSAWVEPKSAWGRGRVELVQIPTPDETNDNIVAYWVPERAYAPQQPIDLEYRIHWQNETETHPPLAWVAQTRRGRAYMQKPDNSPNFIIDFEGPTLAALPADAPMQGVATADANGEIVETTIHRNEVSNGYRLALRVKRKDPKKPVELRAFLRSGEQTVSETWSHLLLP